MMNMIRCADNFRIINHILNLEIMRNTMCTMVFTPPQKKNMEPEKKMSLGRVVC